MRVLVTGAAGLLGRRLVETFADEDLVALSRSALDITDRPAVETAVARVHPDTILNAAAIASPDAAAVDPDRAFAVNAVGPALLASAARRIGACVVHVSSDYVFPGDHSDPGSPAQLYVEWDRTAPKNVYGRSKLAGERAVRRESVEHIVVRTSWVFGEGSGATERIVDELERAGHVTAWTDQWNVPTPVGALAGTIRTLVEQGMYGTWHVCGRGKVSRFEWAREVVALVGGDRDSVLPSTMADTPRPSPRPVDTGMDTSGLRLAGLPEPGDWRPALREVLVSRDGRSGR